MWSLHVLHLFKSFTEDSLESPVLSRLKQLRIIVLIFFFIFVLEFYIFARYLNVKSTCLNEECSLSNVYISRTNFRRFYELIFEVSLPSS